MDVAKNAINTNEMMDVAKNASNANEMMDGSEVLNSELQNFINFLNNNKTYLTSLLTSKYNFKKSMSEGYFQLILILIGKFPVANLNKCLNSLRECILYFTIKEICSLNNNNSSKISLLNTESRNIDLRPKIFERIKRQIQNSNNIESFTDKFHYHIFQKNHIQIFDKKL